MENPLKQALCEAVEFLDVYEYRYALWVCTAEDLIIQKAIAGRTKDWQDIEGIVIERFAQLDQHYLEDWLAQFAEALDQPDIMTHYRQIWQQITTMKGKKGV